MRTTRIQRRQERIGWLRAGALHLCVFAPWWSISASFALFPWTASAQPEAAYSTTQVTLASVTDGKPQELPATLLRPAGDGPFPAIVILHDCSGRGPHSSGAPKRWAERLAPEGYVILIPDSFAPRGFPDGVCTLPLGTAAPQVSPFARFYDAYAALAFLRTLSYVEGAHIGVMGGSHGGTTTLLADVAPPSPSAPLAAERQPGFAAAIALYPGCAGRYGTWQVTRQFGNRGPATGYSGVYQPVAPLLILIGEKDDWTPAEPCERLAAAAQAAGYPVSIKVYPGAYHSFDSPAPTRYVAARRNVNAPNGYGATTGGDPAAWADSIDRVKAFFAHALKGEAANN